MCADSTNLRVFFASSLLCYASHTFAPLAGHTGRISPWVTGPFRQSVVFEDRVRLSNWISSLVYTHLHRQTLSNLKAQIFGATIGGENLKFLFTARRTDAAQIPEINASHIGHFGITLRYFLAN